MANQVTVLPEVELAGVGGGWTSLASDTINVDRLTIRSGMQGGGPSDLLAPTGSASFTLDNSASNSGAKLGYYSLYHANKRSGWGLGIGCRIRLTDPNTSTTYTRFVGRIDAIEPTTGSHGERRVRVVAVDWMDEAARWVLTPEIGEQVGLSCDQIVTNILAEMPVQPTATSFDVGVEAYPYALDTSEGQTALSELGKLAASERGFVYVKRDGTLTLEGRHARLLDTTSDWTITDTDLIGMRVPSTRDEIINTVRVTIHPKIVDDEPTTVVYSQANAIEVAPSATKVLLGPYRDPVTGDPIGATDVQAQVSGSDYVANTAEDGTGTDITADVTVAVSAGPAGARFEVTNNNTAVAYITTNRLLGKGIYDRGSQQYEATDATSIATNGERVATIDMPYQADDDVAQGAADYYLAKYKDPFAQARSITVFGRTSAQLAQILERDISDRLTITETMTGVSEAFFINGIELTVLPSRHVQATYTLAPATDPFSGLYWILGTSTLGTDTIPAPF